MATRDFRFTMGEEIANAITHGIGAALGVAALVILVTFAGMQGDPWKVVSFAIYGSTLMIVYLASTLYHSLTPARAKRVFWILDHASIYLLIAGTYTPFALVHLRGAWGWAIFGIIWGLAVCGVVLKGVFIGRRSVHIIAGLLYVVMGWLILIALKPLLASLPTMGFVWLLVGGVSYTLGLVFFLMNRRYAHAVWHLFVLGGSVCHFFAILLYTLPA